MLCVKFGWNYLSVLYPGSREVFFAPWGHEIYSFGWPFLGHHYYIFTLYGPCPRGEKKIFFRNTSILHVLPQNCLPLEWGGGNEIYRLGWPIAMGWHPSSSVVHCLLTSSQDLPGQSWPILVCSICRVRRQGIVYFIPPPTPRGGNLGVNSCYFKMLHLKQLVNAVFETVGKSYTRNCYY